MNAKEAVDYYISVFPNSKIIDIQYYPTEGLLDFQESMAGKVLVVDFELDGLRYTSLNGGPDFIFSEAVSFVIECKDQQEIDYYWGKLSTVPEAEQCGWCKDQFGLSWQVIPENMAELMQRPDAYSKMMQMHKLVIAAF
jgi:predicted 3-demethylubiquinone-9 3-methyltransferase (glyoxalase superfamily)